MPDNRPALATTTSRSKVLSPEDIAFEMHSKAYKLKELLDTGSDELAKYIYEIRTQKVGDKYVWEWMGFDTEKSYFAAPPEAGGLDLGWRMVRRYTYIHRDLRVTAHIPQELTCGTDQDKLEISRKLIVQDGQVIADDERIIEVLTQAKALSRSDLRKWVKAELGEPVKEVVVAATTYQAPLDLNNEERIRAGGQLWFDMQKGAKCCLRPWKDGERAHIPVSKAAGGRDWEHCVVPLCHEEHQEQHDHGTETWMQKKVNHQGLLRYLYRSLFVVLAENAELKEQQNAGPRG